MSEVLKREVREKKGEKKGDRWEKGGEEPLVARLANLTSTFVPWNRTCKTGFDFMTSI